MKTDKARIEDFLNIMKFEGRPIVSADMMNWLIGMNFFNAPASTKYHGDYDGGLFDHCCEVTENLLELTDKLNIHWLRPESPYIVGMFHDLCKVDDYTKVMDKPGVELFGSDERKGELSHWVHNADVILKGHGDKSVMLLSQFMNLTIEEIYCIRFHMGAYVTSEWNQWDAAIKQFETVLWTHTADMYASKVKGV